MVNAPEHDRPSALTESFRLGDWTVEPALDRISCGKNEAHLEPRVMTVLALLASQPGQVLSREQLEAGAWGNIVVGYDSLSGAINKLRKALGDTPQQPTYIETVSKKGYRLIAPVSPIGQVGTDELSGVLEQGTGPVGKPVLLIIGAVLLATLGALVLLFPEPATRELASVGITADKRIAILPFANLGEHPKQDYLAEGITDDLATDLSNLSGILVVSQTVSSQVVTKDMNPVEVGRQLGADYLLQGSVRKSGDTLRMNLKLINAVDGTNVWAERYTSTESNLFNVQDEVARQVVRSLSLKLSEQDRQRLSHQPTTNFEAYELFLQGQKLFKVRTRESNEAAQDLYRKAIRLDPNFARAYGALAVALDVHYFRGWSESPTSTLDRALEMSQYALELDPGSPQAYWALGYTQIFRREERKAVTAVERAVELSPNYADGYALLALINNYLGYPEKAVEQIKRGMVLNPHYSWDYPYNLGSAYYHLGQYQQAIKSLGQALERNDYARNPRLFLIASLVALDRLEDAQWEAEKIIANSPETTIAHLRYHYPISADGKKLETFLDRLKRAGLPEH